MKEISIYFAGPSVFWPNAKEYGEYLKAKAKEYGFKGIYPYDNEVKGSFSSIDKEIYRLNMQAIQKSDIVIADLRPFRGTEPDSGTVWEIATAKASEKMVIGYVPKYKDMICLVSDMWAVQKEGDKYVDEFGNHIENFGKPLNLMICNGIDHLIEGGPEDAIIYVSQIVAKIKSEFKNKRY